MSEPKKKRTVGDGLENTQEFELCSECFKDEGLKRDASRIGERIDKECPNCKSSNGYKLSFANLQRLCYIFFVRGTIHKVEFGGSPILQFNEQHFSESDVHFSSQLKEDAALIEKKAKIGLFYYGPRLWMVGEIEPLKSLQSKIQRTEIIQRILKIYPVFQIATQDYFYRLRLNPKMPGSPEEYDTAPEAFLGRNRFDSLVLPVLYGSPDLELCLHECRTSVEDEIYVAKLTPTRALKLLNLCVLVNEGETEFESVDIALHFLFLAGKHSYGICREIAKAIHDAGFDGFIYPSYFSYVRTGHIPFETIYGISIRMLEPTKKYAESQMVPNIALFGRPIKENKVAVECINRVMLNKIVYDVSFGPVLD